MRLGIAQALFVNREGDVMQQFTADLDSRIGGISGLSKAPLTPIAEAVANAYAAIDERRRTDPSYGKGRIEISVLRDPQTSLPGTGVISPVIGFRITDDGIGFNDEHIEAFLRLGSDRKTGSAHGAGRFSWLKGFASASVSSVYDDPSGRRERSFVFRLGSGGIDTDSAPAKSEASPGTSVTLAGARKGLRIPSSADEIAHGIAQGILHALVNPDGPDVTLSDGERTIDLRTLVEYEDTVLTVKGEPFRLYHVKRETPASGNSLILCSVFSPAHRIDLNKEIQGLDKSLYDKAGYCYTGIVTGPYLDSHISPSRDSFTLPERPDPDSLLSDELSLRHIVDACLPHITKYLSTDLAAVKQAKDARLDEVVRVHPRLQLSWRQKPEVLRAIQPKDTPAVIEKKLRDAQFGYLETVRRKLERHLRQLDSAVSPARREELLRLCASDIAESAQGPAAESAGYRADTLRLLDHAVHDTSPESRPDEYLSVVLMRPSSEQIPSDTHNLWILDERLTYSAFLAAGAAPEEKDYVSPAPFLLGVPTAWGEKNRQIHGSISIVQLMPSGLDDYTFSHNPLDDMLQYARLLREGNSLDANGNPIVLKVDAQLYLYAVCDITKSLQQALELKGLTRTSDGLGYFGYNEEMKAYIEVVSPEKMLQDAVRRNRALFERLGLPSPQI